MDYKTASDILANSATEDWVTDDSLGVYTYKGDLNLHIKRLDYDHDRPFSEPWAERHADNKAYEICYDVMYGPALIERRRLVSVDGGRATIPMPNARDDLWVTHAAVNFARIVDYGDRVGEYLARSGIEIR